MFPGRGWYYESCYHIACTYMINTVIESKFHGANMGPIWGRQDPGGPHVGPMNFAIWVFVSPVCAVSNMFELNYSIKYPQHGKLNSIKLLAMVLQWQCTRQNRSKYLIILIPIISFPFIMDRKLDGDSDTLFINRGFNTLRSRKMAANFLTTISNIFFGMKIQNFGLKFHWSLLAPARRHTIIWNIDGQFTYSYMRHSALRKCIRFRRHRF